MQIEVLICTHNGEKFLSEQLDSILRQSITVDIVHIHDYSSTDSTRSIILDYTERYSSIRSMFFSEAKGPEYSFLYSLNLIKSDLNERSVLFLADQDDVWLDHKVSRVVSAFNSGIDFVFHNAEIVDSNALSFSKPEYHFDHFWRVERDFCLPALHYANPVIGHTIAMSGELLKKLELTSPESIPMHDWHIAFQVLKSGVGFKYIPEILSLYRQHDSNILGKKSIGTALKRLKKTSKKLGTYQRYLKENHEAKIKLADLLVLAPVSKFCYVFVLVLYKNMLNSDLFHQD